MFCNKCGERNEDGRFCKGCGAPLGNVPQTYAQPQETPKPKKKNIGIWISFLVILVCFVVVIAFVANDKKDEIADINIPASTDSGQAKEEEQPKKPEYIEVTATQLLNEYDTNGVAADQKYKGKMLKITGTVRSIDSDILDDYYITLENNEDEYSFLSVQCYFSDENVDMITGLTPGDVVTVVGRCDGSSLNVIIKNCEIA